MGAPPPVYTLTGGLWQMSSAIVASAGQCLVVDPGYFPREISALVRLARTHGQVRAVAFTHGHWDHIAGWQWFPHADVWTSPALARSIADDGELARRNLAEAFDFDARWYVERPEPLAWPPSPRPLADGERMPLGDLKLQALLLPGHSPDGLALLVEGPAVLLVGDYLSPCEIPFVDDLPAYRATLQRLLTALDDVAEVVPGHGPRLLPEAARDIARADLAYLDALALCAERADAAGAAALPLPRAADVPGMRDHHLDNCRKAGLSV